MVKKRPVCLTCLPTLRQPRLSLPLSVYRFIYIYTIGGNKFCEMTCLTPFVRFTLGMLELQGNLELVASSASGIC